MRLATFKAGGTFSYAGQVSNLDPAIDWGAKSTAKPAQDIPSHDWPPLNVAFAKAADWITTHKYDIALFASTTDTREWWRTAQMAFDILLFNTADPDPVLITETVYIPISKSITPPP